MSKPLSTGIDRPSRRGNLIPFANVNIFDTTTQFYIENNNSIQSLSISDITNHTPSWPLNINQNNEGSYLDQTSWDLYKLFKFKLENFTAPEPTSVVNLSRRQLTTDEIKILSLGKGFCPTPGEPNMGEIKADLDRLHSNFRKRFFFHKINETKKAKMTQGESTVQMLF